MSGLCTLNFAFESELHMHHTSSKENVQRKRERERARQLGLADLHQFRKRNDEPVDAKPHLSDSNSDWTPQLESQLRRRTKRTTLPSMSELAVEFGESDEEFYSGKTPAGKEQGELHSDKHG